MALAKAILSWVNHVDDAVLSASQEVGDNKIANLANPIIGRRWRTTSLTAWGQVDFGEDKTVGILVLRFPRDTTFPTSGTVQHQLDADGGTAGSGAAHDSGAVAINTTTGYGYHVYIPSSPVTARYWRFTFNVSGVSFIDVGRAWAGEAWRPTFSVAEGSDEDEWGDLTRVSASSRSGAEFPDERARQRVMAFGLNALSESERDDIRELQRVIGIAKQMVFVKDPDTVTTETILGRLARSTPIRHRQIPIYSKAFILRESL